MKRMKGLSSIKILGIVVGIIVLIAAGVSYYFYAQEQDAQKLLQGANSQLSQEQVKNLVDKVGKIIELPTGETPQVATVSDKSQLKGQFFANAEDGDTVLIYTNAKKAFLYRPSENKIIEVGPINLEPTKAVASASDSANPKPLVNVALYNGTTTVGLTGKVEKLLGEKEPDVTIIDKENASTNTYDTTVVVDLSKKNEDLSKKLADLTKGSVKDLPAGETAPANADILIILGKSYVE